MSTFRQFGIEFECYARPANASHGREAVASAVRSLGFRAASAQYTGQDYDVWQIKPDGSLDPQGGTCLEAVSPTLPGTVQSLDQVGKVAQMLAARGFDINTSCGLHIHLDAGDMTRYEAAAVALRYHHCQDEIDSILPASRHNRRWAARLTGTALTKVESAVSRKINTSYWTHGERYVSVNLEHVAKGRSAKRIEFRQHSGTLDPAKVVGWYQFLCDFTAETLRLVRSNGGSVTPTVTAQPIIRRQRTAVGTTRSVVVGTTQGPRVPRIDVGTDYDLFLRAIAHHGVVTQQDARSFGWPDTRLRVTAHWLRRHGAELLTTQRNGEVAYVGVNGARTRDEIFTAPAQIRQRVRAATMQATAPMVSSGQTDAATMQALATTPVLSGCSAETVAWFNARKAVFAARRP